MSDTHEEMTADAALLARARTGDSAALEELYADHVDRARRLAVILAGSAAADDLVAGAFARVLGQLRAGRGPSTNFAAYLFTTIRNRHRTTAARADREQPASDTPWIFDDAEPDTAELAIGPTDDDVVAAFGSLPDTWQRVLWHLEVEERRTHEVAELLDMSPAAVSSLAYRAREGLRGAYLLRQLGDPPGAETCAWVQERLPALVRGTLARRATAKVEAHVPGCADCAAALAALERVNERLAAWWVPLVLVGGLGLLDRVSAGQLAAELGARAAGTAAVPAAATATGTPAATTAATGAGAGGASSAGVVAAGASALAVAAAVVALVVTSALPQRDVAEPSASTTPSAGAAVVPGTAPAGPRTGGDTTPPAAPGAPALARATPIDVPDTTAPSAPAPSMPTPTDTSPGTTSTDEATPSQDPATEPTDEPTEVTAAAPTATPITSCNSYGTLQMADTPGVAYRRTAGDGREGAWTVTATAERGHVLAADSPRTFTGDLGTRYACPQFGVAMTTASAPLQRVITVPVVAAGPDALGLRVDIRFSALLPLTVGSGQGWSCRGNGVPVLNPSISCTYPYTGTAPPPLSLTLTVPELTRVGGTMTLSADGTSYDTRRF